MVGLLKTSIAFGLMLAFSAELYAAFAADGPDLPQASKVIPASAFDKAKALAPAFRLQPAPDARGTETDGLGRNDDDCKYGCTDH